MASITITNSTVRQQPRASWLVIYLDMSKGFTGAEEDRAMVALKQQMAVSLFLDEVHRLNAEGQSNT